MKAGLGRFCNEVASALGLGAWNLEVHPDAPGGRTLIVEGDYFADRTLHDGLMSAGTAAGNQPVDMLGCVPPTLVSRDEANRPASSLPAQRLRDWGHNAWDAARADARLWYPVSVSDFRVVPYDSSRGLEGWITILWGLDDFFEYKTSEWQMRQSAGVPSDAERQAALYAARWLMIPLTRAIDTLVIQIGHRPSRVRNVLERVAEQCHDFVEWRTIPATERA
jgi:hypothetical protein